MISVFLVTSLQFVKASSNDTNVNTTQAVITTTMEAPSCVMQNITVTSGNETFINTTCVPITTTTEPATTASSNNNNNGAMTTASSNNNSNNNDTMTTASSNNNNNSMTTNSPMGSNMTTSSPPDSTGNNSNNDTMTTQSTNNNSNETMTTASSSNNNDLTTASSSNGNTNGGDDATTSSPDNYSNNNATTSANNPTEATTSASLETTSSSNENGETSPSIVSRQATVTFKGNYSAVKAELGSETAVTNLFCSTCQSKMNIVSDNFKNCLAREGSVIVTFDIVADQQTNDGYFDQLFMKWEDKSMDIPVTINSVTVVYPMTALKKDGQDHVYKAPSAGTEDESDSTWLALLIVFLLLAIIIVVGVCVYIFVFKKKQKVITSSSLPLSFHILQINFILLLHCLIISKRSSNEFIKSINRTFFLFHSRLDQHLK